MCVPFHGLRAVATLSFLLLLQVFLQAQVPCRLSGRVQDKQSREAVIDAAIWIPALQKGTTANVDGFYELTVPSGEYRLEISSLGYAPIEISLQIDKDQTRNFFLQTDAVLLDGIEVKGSRASRESQNTIGMVSITSEMVQKIPALLGEPDIIKAVQLLPGVLMSTETSSGFSVRGGGLDQNAIILDQATLYNPTHTCGFFSVFNNDVVGLAQIYKGDIPISYGGRLASVIDVTMKEGDFRNYHLDASIGLLVAKATVNGPIWKGRTSFLAAARATCFDLFLPLAGMKGTRLGFYDFNAKVVHKFANNRDKLSLSGYFGRDRFGLESMDIGLDYGNSMLSLTWAHLFSNRFVMNANVHLSDYLSYAQQNTDGYDFVWKTRITDYVGKMDWTFSPENHELRFGFDLRYHIYQPGDLTVNMYEAIGFVDSNYNYRFNQDHYHALESGLYIGNNPDKIRFASEHVFQPRSGFSVSLRCLIQPDRAGISRGSFVLSYLLELGTSGRDIVSVQSRHKPEVQLYPYGSIFPACDQFYFGQPFGYLVSSQSFCQAAVCRHAGPWAIQIISWQGVGTIGRSLL